MRNINKTVLELDVIYSTMKHGEVINMTLNLKEVKEELLDIRKEILETSDFDNYSELNYINTQLKYLEMNIKTLETALMCFETKITEKRPSLGDLSMFFLN